MDEDEDTYGFGSFSELFDAAPVRAAKRLDVGALSRFFMSERLLARFQAQQRRARPPCDLFQHVAAKFDSVALEGGLGSLGVAALDGGGVVWLQKERSDSDALERRAKELQDITNRRDDESENGAKSAAALFVAVKEVEAVQPTSVQNTVQGVELKLRDGNRLELTFMPGPYSGSTHRDEFLEALKKTMDGASEKEDGGEAASTSTHAGTPADREVAGPDAAKKEEFRQLVRRYTTLDPMSHEGLEIAKQVHAGTGYRVGPTTKQTLKFAADSEYRKKTVAQLSEFLKRMNQDWSEAEAQREQHTKARHSRNDDDLLEYTDTVTGAQIPTRTYERRYLEYVKASEVAPVLHLVPAKVKAAESTAPAPLASAEDDEKAERALSFFKATLGLDPGPSCIIDKDLFAPDGAHASSGARARADDVQFRAKVDHARSKLWESWGSAAETLTRNVPDKAERRQDHSKHRTQTTPGVAGHLMRKRARERRRSLVLPSAEDLQSSVEANGPGTSQVANGTASNGADERQPRAKRSRSASHKSDSSRKSKSRRQSLVGTVDLSSAVTPSTEEKRCDQRRTRESNHKSPRVRHPANGYARETSALEMVGDEDSDLCQLCYSERALVHMKPCGHVVCTSCWSRLSPSSGKNGSSSRRVCPWDREDVTKRLEDNDVGTGRWALTGSALSSDCIAKRRLTCHGVEENQRVTPEQASATVARLLQWKKRNDAQRKVKARLQEDERLEEHECLQSLSKTLPLAQAQAAASRNYLAAGELRWRKLMLQASAERQQVEEDEAECTFRPKLVSRPPRRATCTARSSKQCRPLCASVTAPKTFSAGRPPPRHHQPISAEEGDVFERLSKPQACVLTTAEAPLSATEKRLSAQAEASFIARQERDQKDRQCRRSQLAAQQRFPHKPRLSRHTQELCAALRDTDTRTERLRSEPKRSSSTKQVRYTIPTRTSSDCKLRPCVASRPFHSLVEALQQQEKRMRSISKCA